MQNYKKHTPTVLTVDYDGKKMTQEIHWDSGLDDMKQCFKTILLFMTFTEDQLKDLFPDEEDFHEEEQD